MTGVQIPQYYVFIAAPHNADQHSPWVQTLLLWDSLHCSTV